MEEGQDEEDALQGANQHEDFRTHWPTVPLHPGKTAEFSNSDPTSQGCQSLGTPAFQEISGSSTKSLCHWILSSSPQ